jgi:hypothetical protein
MRNHWQEAHEWSPAENGGRPTRILQKNIQECVNRYSEKVHCQRLLVQGKGSQYFQVYQPCDGSPEMVLIDGDAAWAQVGEQMAKAWVNVKLRAQNTIQEGKRDEVNSWLERTQ